MLQTLIDSSRFVQYSSILIISVHEFVNNSKTKEVVKFLLEAMNGCVLGKAKIEPSGDDTINGGWRPRARDHYRL
jgi:hypothetical protein